MRRFITIASNAFMELVRQPVFLLLMTAVMVFQVFLAAVPYFGFGDDPKLVKDSVLAVMLVAGLFGAVLSASASVAREIRSGTALAVLAKPVGRAQFLLAKFAGVAAALTLMAYASVVGALLASRMAFDAYGDADTFGLKIFFGFLVVAYACGGFVNYFLNRAFVSNTVGAVVLLMTLAFILINCFDKEGQWQAVWAKDVDWRLVPAAVLILFALWILSGLAIAASTRWDMIATLAICTGFFFAGLMSDYFFGRRAQPVWTLANLQDEIKSPRWSEPQRRLLRQTLERHDQNHNGRLDPEEQAKLSSDETARLRAAGLGPARWAQVLYTALPNWQLFWLADALEGQKKIPWSYVATALTYVIGYVGAALAVALVLFEERELS